jgi:hypothetical protein
MLVVVVVVHKLWEYYEIDRFVAEIQMQIRTRTCTMLMDSVDRIHQIRAALQLPDEFLPDAAELCWAYETALSQPPPPQVKHPPSPPPVVEVEYLDSWCLYWVIRHTHRVVPM